MHRASFLALLVSSACVARDPSGDGGSSSSDTGGSSTGASATTATATMSTSADVTTVATSASTNATSDAEVTTNVDTSGTSSAETFSFITGPDLGEGTGVDLPNGSPCADAVECASGFCHNVPGPGDGACSECDMDIDCGAGTCSYDGEAGYAVCTAGELGDGCDSDEGCAGALVCSRQFGDSGPHHCSECRVDDVPCVDEGTACVAVFGDSPFQGYLGCVAPGTVELGGGCPVVDGVGDGTYCVSGACGVVSIMMGSVDLGICSDCDGDEDCADGLLCQPPDFGMGMITPGTCG